MSFLITYRRGKFLSFSSLLNFFLSSNNNFKTALFSIARSWFMYTLLLYFSILFKFFLSWNSCCWSVSDLSVTTTIPCRILNLQCFSIFLILPRISERYCFYTYFLSHTLRHLYPEHAEDVFTLEFVIDLSF